MYLDSIQLDWKCLLGVYIQLSEKSLGNTATTITTTVDCRIAILTPNNTWQCVLRRSLGRTNYIGRVFVADCIQGVLSRSADVGTRESLLLKREALMYFTCFQKDLHLRAQYSAIFGTRLSYGSYESVYEPRQLYTHTCSGLCTIARPYLAGTFDFYAGTYLQNDPREGWGHICTL